MRSGWGSSSALLCAVVDVNSYECMLVEVFPPTWCYPLDRQGLRKACMLCLVPTGRGETKWWNLQGTSRSLRVYRLEREMSPAGLRV